MSPRLHSSASSSSSQPSLSSSRPSQRVGSSCRCQGVSGGGPGGGGGGGGGGMNTTRDEPKAKSRKKLEEKIHEGSLKLKKIDGSAAPRGLCCVWLNNIPHVSHMQTCVDHVGQRAGRARRVGARAVPAQPEWLHVRGGPTGLLLCQTARGRNFSNTLCMRS